MDTDKLSAYQTLYQVLVAVSKLAAPIAPFFMDRLYTDLVEGADSVHYVAMPEYDETVVDKDLEERMALAQRATSMVLALRRKAEINVRKPLSKIIIPVIDAHVKEQLELVKTLILNEVNVKEAEFISDTAGLITKKIKPNFKTLGKIYGKQMKEIAAAFGTLGQDVINAIQSSETSGTGYVLNLPSGDVTLNKGDYEISSEDMPGWLVATEGAMTIALDITITEELKQEGVARELINRIQNLRKSSGFDVTDKVDVVIYADGEDGTEISASLANFAEYIAAQTLALSVKAASVAEADDAPEVEWNEGTIRIKVTKK
jgi:isoleucyl-tRNA synthetase